MTDKRDRASKTPDFPGSYSLLISVRRPLKLRIGALGEIFFEAGLYAYTGSAMSGVWSRLARHLRRRKRTRWHIDYLVREPGVAVIGFVLAPSSERRECAANTLLRSLRESKMTVVGFGSSDCRRGCGGHLVYLRASNKMPRAPRCDRRGLNARKDDEAYQKGDIPRSSDEADALSCRNPKGQAISRIMASSLRLDASSC